MFYQLNDGHDDVATAKALLQHVSRRLAPVETEICDKIAQVSSDYDLDMFTLHKDEWMRFNSLKIEFAREIAQWKEGA